jgi:membrane protein implicated in regulation of membrane protease activity
MGKKVMIGDKAVVVSATREEVEVEYRGEIWKAVSSQPMEPGRQVFIEGVEGMILRVSPFPPPGKKED